MADIKQVLPILYNAEFSTPSNALEWNDTETGFTFMGIYQSANPTWLGWQTVRETIKKCNNDIKLASEILFRNKDLFQMVEIFYKKVYWDRAKLDYVKSTKISSEIFIFGVVANMPPSIRKAQEIVGTKVDGSVGEQTLKALNSFDEKIFDYAFDEKEIEYFKEVVKNNPQKARFLNGWINRAHLV